MSLLMALVQGFFAGTFAKALEEDPMAIDINDASELEGVLWLDARSRAAYESGHLEGALLLNEDEWDSGLDGLLAVWIPGQPLVVYCDGGGCAASRNVALRLREEFGMEAVHWLVDGWDALVANGKVEP